MMWFCHIFIKTELLGYCQEIKVEQLYFLEFVSSFDCKRVQVSSFRSLGRQRTKALDKAVLAKILLHSNKYFAIFLTFHSEDFLNAARSVVDN